MNRPLKQLDGLDALKWHLESLPLDDPLLNHEHFPLDAVLEPEVVNQRIGPREDQESGSTKEEVAQGVVAERHANEQRPCLLSEPPQKLGGQDQDPEGVLAARLEEVHYPVPVRVSRTARRRSASSSSRPAILIRDVTVPDHIAPPGKPERLLEQPESTQHQLHQEGDPQDSSSQIIGKLHVR